jgi:predicted dehydrogenase
MPLPNHQSRSRGIINHQSVAWGILGTGSIAHTFAAGLAESRTGRLVAVGSRAQGPADAFAREFGLDRAHGGYEALLADPAVQAVYISTPHPSHAEWCIAAARAGKHILCEKPLTMNHAEAVAVAAAAREHGVFLMEAFMYRCHPQTARVVELIRGGEIGQVGVVQAAFSFHAAYDPGSRLFNHALGGGGILDVGCYTMSVARLAAGAARGLPFLDPVKITGFARLHPDTGTDLFAVASVEFPGGILGQLACGVGLDHGRGVRVFGGEGSIHIPPPWPIAPDDVSIFLTRKGSETPEEIVIEKQSLFALEADSVGDALARGERESPHMTVADSLGNMAALDQWRASAGVVYKGELPSH